MVLLSIIRQSKNIGCCCPDVIFHIRRLPLWGVCTTPWAESQKVRKQETTGCSHPPRHMMACHMFSAALYFKLLTLFYLPISSMKGRCVLSAAEMQYKHCVLVLNQLDNQGQVITCSSSYYIFRSWLFIRKHTFKFEMFSWNSLFNSLWSTISNCLGFLEEEEEEEEGPYVGEEYNRRVFIKKPQAHTHKTNIYVYIHTYIAYIHIHTCVCVCACMCLCTYMCVYAYICIYKHTRAFICGAACVYVYLHMYACVYAHAYTNIQTHVHIYVCLHVFVCMYLHVYLHTLYTNTHPHIQYI